MKELFRAALEEIMEEEYPDQELYDLSMELQDELCDRAMELAGDKLAGMADAAHDQMKEEKMGIT